MLDRGGLKSWLMLVEVGVGDSMRRNFGTRADVDPFQLTYIQLVNAAQILGWLH